MTTTPADPSVEAAWAGAEALVFELSDDRTGGPRPKYPRQK